MRILKFGGSSVGTPERVQLVIDIILNARKREHIAVVVSAFQGVTDQLIHVAMQAASGNKLYTELFRNLEARHLNTAKKLLSKPAQTKVIAAIRAQLNELQEVLHGVFLVRELTPRTLDFIMSFGERFSAYIISESLKSRKKKAEFLDARKVIKTDQQFGSAKVDIELSYPLIQEHFASKPNLQIITGFIGSSLLEETTTLGRGGSDYTASLIGAALSADEIEIWTDVDGVMTADPRRVKSAFPISSLSYEEAMEMSHFGAKIIYPPTMQPALRENIPLRIKNTFHPEFPGTLIGDALQQSPYVIKGISSISDVALCRLQGTGMVGVAGISSRLFGALAAKKISVILITQSSSEHSICFAIEPTAAPEAKRAIDEEFFLEMKAEQIDPVIVESDHSIIAVVGERMRSTAGISGRLFQALGKNAINVAAVAQGSSELNISVVLKKEEEARALNAVHDTFFLSGVRPLHVFLVGTGLIGKALTKQIQNQESILKMNHSLDVRLTGIANSKKMLLNSNGISWKNWQTELENTGVKADMKSYMDQIKGLRMPNSVFVDCTASDSIPKLYSELLELDISVVTPNKKGNSGNQELYTKRKKISGSRRVPYLYEATVGAGLPVIGTLQDLVRSGDTIIKIEAILSGTLNYIFSTLSQEKPFSKVVKEAKELGFTEPDPRDDLSGMDVARKSLILAREAGYAMELADITIEDLLTDKCRKAKTLDQLFLELEKLDPVFETRREEADKKEKRLRYIARIQNGTIEISLQAIGSSHPFYSVSGSDNILAFTTRRYRNSPLLVRGPGAGAEVTAAGVFADLIRVSHYLS